MLRPVCNWPLWFRRSAGAPAHFCARLTATEERSTEAQRFANAAPVAPSRGCVRPGIHLRKSAPGLLEAVTVLCARGAARNDKSPRLTTLRLTDAPRFTHPSPAPQLGCSTEDASPSRGTRPIHDQTRGAPWLRLSRFRTVSLIVSLKRMPLKMMCNPKGRIPRIQEFRRWKL